MRNHELMQAIVPTRQEKQRLGRALGLGESIIYKWCADPEGAGRPNPFDHTDVILDHARLHHPEMATEVEGRIVRGNLRAFGRRAAGMTSLQAVAALQPGSEKEALEAVRALSSALRELALTDDCDLDALIREIEEAERHFRMAAIMIRAVRDQQAAAKDMAAR